MEPMGTHIFPYIAFLLLRYFKGAQNPTILIIEAPYTNCAQPVLSIQGLGFLVKRLRLQGLVVKEV